VTNVGPEIGDATAISKPASVMAVSKAIQTKQNTVAISKLAEKQTKSMAKTKTTNPD